jgi:hypothetical protein
VGIYAAREAIQWPLVDRGPRFDFRSAEPFLEASLKHEIDIVWDLFHYGYPANLDLFSPEFPKRFAEYCYAVAKYLSKRCQGLCSFTRVNVPSFFAWAAGEVAQLAPHARNRGKELKIALAKAAIGGINSIRSVAPTARTVKVDPMCHVVAPRGNAALEQQAYLFNSQWVVEA